MKMLYTQLKLKNYVIIELLNVHNRFTKKN